MIFIDVKLCSFYTVQCLLELKCFDFYHMILCTVYKCFNIQVYNVFVAFCYELRVCKCKLLLLTGWPQFEKKKFKDFSRTFQRP